MTTNPVFRWSDRLALLATGLAGLASAAGLAVNGLYRDNDAMVAQAQGTDLATLFAAIPAIGIGLWFARSGSVRWRPVVLGGVGYLIYSYAIYSFQVVISAATPAHIAILGLASWSLILGGFALARVDVEKIGDHLPRRTTIVFLALIVVMFAGLWLSQIAAAISSGVLPVAVSDLALPTSAVYPLDLAFALPLLAVAAALLVRGEAHGPAVATSALVFVVLMALSILGLFAVQAAEGIAVDASMTVAFGVIAVIAAVLAGTGLAPARAYPASPRDVAHATR